VSSQLLGLILPWMPKELSPNSRAHWAVKAKAVKQYRGECRDLAYLAGWKRLECVKNWAIGQKLRLEIDFYKPSNRGDDDNLEAMFKAGRDGLSDAIGIDDKHFVAHRTICGVANGGRVIVRLTDE
jgi:crossover junction endodeoxyribonuclease RusA